MILLPTCRYLLIAVKRLAWLSCITLIYLPMAQCLGAEYAQVKVTEPYVDMRSGPASGYPVVFVAEQGQWLSIIKRRTNWFKVQTEKGQQGWVSQANLHLMESASGASVDLADGSFADFANRQFELGLQAGTFDGIPSVTLSADWMATENIALGASIGQAIGSFSENKLLLFNITHTAFPEWKIAPYVMLGAGKIRTTPKGGVVQSGDEVRSDNLLLAGVGLRYYVARNFIMKLEYNNLLVKTDRDVNEEVGQWKLGFAVFF